MKRFILIIVFPLACLFQACDKIDFPYQEGNAPGPVPANSITINNGTITGLIIDYNVSSATESDTSLLSANWYYLESNDTSFASVIFEWHGIKSDSLVSAVTPKGVVNFNDTLSIAAGSPFGTLTFHYIADIGSPGTGIATVIVNIVNAQSVRKIIIADFTAQQCVHCPKAARKLTELENIYGEQVIGLAIHQGSFAIPNTSGTMYTYDFRTPEGTQLGFDLGVSTWPNGSINFKIFNGSLLQQYPSWGGSVSNLLQLPPDADITLSATYNSATKLITADVTTTFLNTLNGNYNLAVYLTESNIVNWQRDVDAVPPDNPNYVHNHVLRGSLNGTYGDLIAVNPQANSTSNKQYTLVLNGAYNENNCDLVAFVFDKTTKEIVQAEKIKLIP